MVQTDIPPSTTQDLQEAIAHHKTGKLEDAKARYKEVLKSAPLHPVANHNIGFIEVQQGRAEAALPYFVAALNADPSQEQYWLSYIDALIHAGRMEEASQALMLAQQHGLNGEKAENIMLLIRNTAQKLELALEHQQAGRDIEAFAICQEVLQKEPNNPDALHMMGLLADKAGKHDIAVELISKALEFAPDFAYGHLNLGSAYQELGRLPEAIASFRRTISLKPDLSEAHYNLGNALNRVQRANEARISYRMAISLKSDNPDAIWNKSLNDLLLGDYREGWKLFEWRWKSSLKNARRNFMQPLWLGEDAIPGKRILVHAEQGLGDVIQFSRYIPLLERMGAKVIAEVPQALMSVISTVSPTVDVVPTKSALPEFDVYIPIMSLPLAFKTTVDSIPAMIPYLYSNPLIRQTWKEKLAQDAQFRVGLVWSGGFRADQPKLWATNNRRNIPLSQLACLNVPGVSFYSIQKGNDAVKQLHDLEASGWSGPKIIDYTDELSDFSDTAAIIDNLDLVIAVDTSTAHLAGALGKEVWLLNRFDTCWRWFIDREDSPWYPTMRIFRQPVEGDWESVVSKVKQMLLIKAAQFQSG